MIVDDDEDDRYVIDQAFLEIDYAAEVKKFITSEAMMQYLKQIDAHLLPSLIVLDNSIGAHNATDVVRTLRENEVYRSIPVVIYTTGTSPGRKQELASLGVYRYIEKAGTMNEVVAIARELKAIAEEQKEA